MLVDSRLCTQASKKEIKFRLEVESKGRRKDIRSLTNSTKMQTQPIPLYMETSYSTSCGNQEIPLQCGNQESTLCGQKSLDPPCVGRSFCLK
jgi:hypothetical protein